MRVTGLWFRQRIKSLEADLRVLRTAFNQNLYQFPSDEDLLDPRKVQEEIWSKELAVTHLQALQAQYNLQVPIRVDGLPEMTLAQAVKLVGGAGRVEAAWKQAVGDDDEMGYLYGQSQRQRSREDEIAVKAVPDREALELFKRASRIAGALRSAIEIANTTEVEVDIPETLQEV